MGFLDKAKAKIADSLGEETVRVVDYDADPLEKQERQKAPAKSKGTLSRARDLAGKLSKKEEDEEGFEEQERKRLLKKGQRSQSSGEEAPRSRKRERGQSFAVEGRDHESYEEVVDGFDNAPDTFDSAGESAFDVEEDSSYFSEQQARYDAALQERFEGVPTVEVQGGEIQDVLSLLGISSAFAIERDVLLPEDLQEAASFDLQAPYGFEQGQVNAFVERTRVSVERYVAYLTQRNADVAKLATVVDRLQVDLNNLKFQTEISNGINVMPTMDSEDVESKYMEARLTIKRLEDQLRALEGSDSLSDSEREKYDALQDQVSILQRENETLEEENYNLKNRLAFMEEAADDTPPPAPKAEESVFGGFEEEEAEESLSELPPVPEAAPARKPTPVPSAFLVEDEEEDAPLFTDSSSSLFAPEEDDEGPAVFLLDEQGGTSAFTLSEEDEEDPLDALMRDWKNED